MFHVMSFRGNLKDADVNCEHEIFDMFYTDCKISQDHKI